MECLAVIGVNARCDGTEALEAWTLGAGDAGALDDVREAVLLKTCNRVEHVLALRDRGDLEGARARLGPVGHPGRVMTGWAALEHLCRVAAGLESMNPGEDQIQHQVRRSLEAGRDAGRVGPLVGFAFDAALRAAKRVRREVPLAPRHTSLFSLARPSLEALLPEAATVAVVGAGEMGALAAGQLALRPRTALIIVNRNMERAATLAQTLGARAMSLEAFWQDAPALDGLVCATPVEHLVGRDFLARQPGLRAAVDLGMPRNVDAAAARDAGVTLLDLERLRALGEARREALEGHIARAEGIVRLELEAARGDWAEREVGPLIAQLRDLYRDTIARTVGDRLTPEETERLAHRFAHVPAKGLRGLARQRGPAAAYAFLDAAGLTAKEPTP